MLAWWGTARRVRRMFAGAAGRRSAMAATVAITTIAACGAWFATRRDDGTSAPAHLRISFLDVGQGDATLIQDRGAAVLVDTGPPGAHVVARLRHAGVRRLDALVVTHAQLDHDGGAPSVLAALPVGMILDGRDGVRTPVGEEMASIAARRHVRLITPAVGQALRTGRLAVRILWPRREPRALHVGADPNDRAIVSLVRDGGVSVLLAADVESDVLAGLDLPAVDVMKVSHHGSADAGLPALLARLRPSIAVISVGAGNPYGHPAATTVRALSRAVPHVYRTDRDGSVRIDDVRGVLEVRLHA
jgi:competence protein ComEC